MRPRRLVRRMQAAVRALGKLRPFRRKIEKPVVETKTNQPTRKSPWKMRLVKIGSATVIVAAAAIATHYYHKPAKRPVIVSSSWPLNIAALTNERWRDSESGRSVATLLRRSRLDHRIGTVAIQRTKVFKTNKDIDRIVKNGWIQLQEMQEKNKLGRMKSIEEQLEEILDNEIMDPFLAPILAEAMSNDIPIRVVEEYNRPEWNRLSNLRNESDKLIRKAEEETNIERAYWLNNQALKRNNQQERLREKKIRLTIDHLSHAANGGIFLIMENRYARAMRDGQFRLDIDFLARPSEKRPPTENDAIYMTLLQQIERSNKLMQIARLSRELTWEEKKREADYFSYNRYLRAKMMTRPQFDSMIRRMRGKGKTWKLEILNEELDKIKLPENKIRNEY